MFSSFYPVVAGRTSDIQSNLRSLFQVQTSKAGINRLQDQLTTGRKILTPSEDPTSSIRIMQFQREQEFRTQAITNLNSSTSFLNGTESSLSDIQSIVNDMRGLTVSAASNLNSPSERDAIVSEVDSSINRLLASANSKFQDRYLFSGSSVSTSPVAYHRTAIRFYGDEKSLLTVADSGQTIASNVTGQRALGVQSAGVVSTVDLAPAAIPSTRLDDLNGGSGVSPGAISFTDGNEKVTIDLAAAGNLNDVLSLVNGQVKLGGRDVQLSLQTNGTLSVQYADGLPGVIRIDNVGAGYTATDLGIATTVASPGLPIVSPSLDPILKLTTKLSQLNDGAGFDATQGFRITQGDRSYTVVVGTAQTVEDIFNAIRKSGAAMTADITADGRSIQIRSTESGTDFSIGENGGLLATRLGIRTQTANTRLDQFNYGRGVRVADGSEINIRKNDGSIFSVDLSGSVTVQDVMDRINNNVANADASTKVTAQLNAVGNGLTISSVLPALGAPNPQPIAITALQGSQTAWDLGLIPVGQSTVVGTVTATDSRIVGVDGNPQEVRGIFNSMLRFRDAVQTGDSGAIARASDLLDQDLERIGTSRSSLGVSLLQIDDLNRNHEDRFNDLKASESKYLDADLASTITELNGRQIAYEAGLKLLADNNRLNLFNYI